MEMKTMKAKIKPLVTCPMSQTVREQAQKGPIDIPFLIRYDGRGAYLVFAEDLLPENKVGRLEYIEGTRIPGNKEAMGTIDSVLESRYEMRVTGWDASSNLLDSEIRTGEDTGRRKEDGEPAELSAAWEKAMAMGIPFTEEFKRTVTEFFDLHEIGYDLRLRTVSGYSLPVDEDGKPLTLEKPASMWMPTDTPNEKTLYYSSYAAAALEQALDGNPIIYEGPKSVGKNFLDEWIAYVMGAVYYEISVDPDMAKSELYGDKVIDDASARNLSKEKAEAYLRYVHERDSSFLEDAAEHEYWSKYTETMRFVVESTEFKRWLRQRSGRRVLMVNEINYGNPTVLAVVFNRVAEDRPVRFVDIPGEGRIYVGSDCILTASMNRGYVGTVELNEAMRSRFGVIEMQPSAHIKPILKDKIESEFGKGVLADAYYKACDDLYVYMVARASSAGSAAQYGDKAVSIRSFIRALRAVALKSDRKPKSLRAQLNIHLRGQCDTDMERASLSDDINEKVGDL